MDCVGALISLWREKKTCMYFGELTYDIWIDHGFSKENAKFIEF